MAQIVRIGDREVGPGRPTFVIAEIGYNFNSIQQAKASIDAAVNCGVDAVKFQTFKADTVVARDVDFPPEAGATNQYQEFKKYEISEQVHRELFAHARTRGVIAFSTPSYYDDVDLLERLEVPVHKIGSDDLTNLPFIRYVAQTRKPVIFSTGMATLSEVDEALQTILSTGNDQVIVLHCVSNYPVKDIGLMNLRVITTYRQAFNIPVGLSDHTTTMTAALGAVALGAVAIERHFTIDKKLDVPDAFFSADPPEMKALVHGIREMERALGDGVKRPTPTEREMRLETRKSAVARRDIAPNQLITAEDITIKRPGTGVLPRETNRLIGKRANRLIKADAVITWEMVG